MNAPWCSLPQVVSKVNTLSSGLLGVYWRHTICIILHFPSLSTKPLVQKNVSGLSQAVFFLPFLILPAFFFFFSFLADNFHFAVPQIFTVL